jgi:poly-gamma-glutamate synthesis protein (capsule biosynthesis protein)
VREPVSPLLPAPTPEPERVVVVPVHPPKLRLELTFVGDVMFGGWFDGQFRAVPVPALDPLGEVDGLLASDLAFANLETPVVATIPGDVTGHLRFGATPDQVVVLPRHGIRAVTVANNHANDLGDMGMTETPRHLDALGIAAAGAARDGQPAVRVETIEIEGWRVGVIAATVRLNRKSGAIERIPWMRAEELVERVVPVVAEARRDHDVVIVALHWGVERADRPDRWQVEAAHALVDAGADAVIGSHPHVLQGIERYRGSVIAYSLGNFVFRNVDTPQRFTGVLRLAFENDCLAGVAFHPAVMRGGELAHPQPAGGHTFDEVAARLSTLSASRPLEPTRWDTVGDRLVTAGACR